jgi:lipid A 4'-phosphatase
MGARSLRSLAAAAAALGALAAALFLTFPEIDLHVASLFHDPVQGFVLANAISPSKLHAVLKVVVIAAVVVPCVRLAYRLQQTRDGRSHDMAVTAFLLAALAMGPGLVTNTLFKDHWGRARPRDMTVFGGTRDFTPPLLVADQCARNCSFVAGDPSVGFYFVAFAPVFARRRYAWIAFGLGAGSALGIIRMGQGAHFLSDVIFSGVFNILTIWLVHALILGRSERGPPKKFVPDRKPARPADGERDTDHKEW